MDKIWIKCKEVKPMDELKFTPIGEPYLTPRQRLEQYIQQLEWVVVALSALCIGLAATACILAAGTAI